METITNAASTVGSTVSNLIYGAPAKENETTANNETAGQEPLSGQQGKGTAAEPFDQGNAANPVDATSKTNTFPAASKDTTATSGNTSYNQEDFLTLNPSMGKPTTTEPSHDVKSDVAGGSSMPIVPLNPDVATMGTGETNTTSSATGVTDKAGVTDKVWKSSALDEIAPSGAPGAGPPAPEFTPATPDMSTSTTKEAVAPTTTDATKDTTPSATAAELTAPKNESTTHDSSDTRKASVDQDIDAILEKTPPSKHSVDDKEADDPHSKMQDKTVRQTDASKHGEADASKSLASEKVGSKAEPTKSAETSSSTGNNDKEGNDKDGKMSHLKDKLKNKLHIGSKDK